MLIFTQIYYASHYSALIGLMEKYTLPQQISCLVLFIMLIIHSNSYCHFIFLWSLLIVVFLCGDYGVDSSLFPPPSPQNMSESDEHMAVVVP